MAGLQLVGGKHRQGPEKGLRPSITVCIGERGRQSFKAVVLGCHLPRGDNHPPEFQRRNTQGVNATSESRGERVGALPRPTPEAGLPTSCALVGQDHLPPEGQPVQPYPSGCEREEPPATGGTVRWGVF